MRSERPKSVAITNEGRRTAGSERHGRRENDAAIGMDATHRDSEAVDILFGYTGRQLDETTGLQNNFNRWYDAAVGSWVSEDPIGFAAGDANLYRYVGNKTLSNVDSIGLHGGAAGAGAGTGFLA